MINGRKGRAKELARIRRKTEREAAAAGVDITDRAALSRWENEHLTRTCERIQRNAGKPVDQWD
jgi:hypothetical protein